MADHSEPASAARRDLPKQADMMNMYDRTLLAAIIAAEAALTDTQALAIFHNVRGALRDLETRGPLPGQLWGTRDDKLWASVQTCDGTALVPVATDGDVRWSESQVVHHFGPLDHIDPHGDD